MRSAWFTLCVAGCLWIGLSRTFCAAQTAPEAPASAAEARTGEDIFARAREQIRRDLARSGVPSVAVAVARNGKIIWEEGFGWADAEKKIPATADTVYCLASVSKPLTATGLMLLVERGKINLDAPVNDYLAKDGQVTVWIGDPKDVTVRRVANHAAGLPRHEHFYRSHEMASMPDMDEAIRRYGNIVTLPGERYRYSNFGYGILDYVIARTSGESFADFMRQEVFLPLGMTHTSVDLAPDLAKFGAVRYEGKWAVPPYSFDHVGASGIWSSVHDLALFGMFHLGQLGPEQRPIFSDKTRLAMQAPAISMHGNAADVDTRLSECYGIGWVVGEDAFGRTVNHRGGMGGVATSLLLWPDQGVVVAVAANSFNPVTGKVENAVLTALFPGYERKQAEFEKAQREARNRRNPQTPAAHQELSGDWEGRIHTFEKDIPIALSFAQGGTGRIRLGAGQWLPIGNPELTDGWLSGSVNAELGTLDARRMMRHIVLDLKLRGDVINGAVILDIGNAISYWTELRRK